MKSHPYATNPNTSMHTLKPYVRKFLGIPVTVLSFLFILKIFFDNRGEIVKALLVANPVLFLIGVVFFSLFFIIKSLLWLEILKKRGYQPPKRVTLWKYAFSEIKRYIPGSIFAFMGRMQTHDSFIPQKETLKGIGIEALLLALSALIVSIPAISYPVFKAREEIAAPFILPVAAVILISAAIFAFLYVRFKKTMTTYFDSLLLFTFSWVLYALGCFFIAISFTYIYPTNLVFVLSFFVFSWLCGYLLFITPMGLGVRELVIVASLSLFVPASFASLIAIMTRVGMVLGEFLSLLVFYVFAKIKANSQLLSLNPYFLIVSVFAFCYFLFFTSYTIARHDAFLSGRFDLGNMSQTVWNTSQGNFFMLTNPDGTEKISRLADHSDILLVLFAPLYLLWSDPKVLLIVQSLVLALGGIVVYFLAKEILKSEKLSLALSLSFYLNFWIHEQNIFDFHAVTVGTTLLLASFLFLIKKKYVWFSLFLVLSVMTKENVFLVASFFGLYLLFKQRKIVPGILLTVIPTIIFFYLTSKAIPHARGNVHFALSYYSYIGSSTQGIVKNILLHPQIVLGHIFSLSSFYYLNELFIPTGYLALLSPLYLVFALPDMAISLLSTNTNLRSYQYHYGAIVMPFVYISTMYGMLFLIHRIKKLPIKNILFYYILFSALITCYFYSPIPGMKDADYRPYTAQNTLLISHYLSLIPQNSSVSASNNVGAHLSHRDNIYVIPFALESADYIVLYGERKSTVNSVNRVTHEELVQDTKNNFYLFKKRENSTCSGNCKP